MAVSWSLLPLLIFLRVAVALGLIGPGEFCWRTLGPGLCLGSRLDLQDLTLASPDMSPLERSAIILHRHSLLGLVIGPKEPLPLPLPRGLPDLQLCQGVTLL